MNELLTQLKALTSLPNTQSSLQKMQEYLLPFDSLLPDKATDSEVQSIETVLLSLLKINNGVMAPHCAICVGSHLVPLYKLESSHRFWNLIQVATDQPTPANLFCVGYVIKKIGHDSRSSLSNLAQTLTTLKEPLIYPALYALYNLYKICGNVLSKFANGAFSFAKNYTYSQHEPTQIAAIKLIEVLVPFTEIQSKKFISVAESTFKYSKSFFSLNECARLAALCVAEPYMKNTKSSDQEASEAQENQDFAIKAKSNKKGESSDLQNQLNLLKKFKNSFNLVFQYFLDFLEPEFVFKNAKQLIDFSLTVSPTSHTKVTAFFARDVRADLLQKLLLNPNTPFSQLRTLTFDAESAIQVADLAATKILGTDQSEKYAAGLYFIALTNSYPEQAREYLLSAIEFLSNPPANVNLREYDAKSLIASIILSVLDNKQSFLKTNSESVRKIFISIINNKNILMIHLQDYFMLLSTLPEDFIDAGFVTQQISSLIDTMKKQLAVEERSRKIPSRLIEFSILFFSMHPKIKDVSVNINMFVETVFQHITSLTNVAILGFLQLITKINPSEALVTNCAFFYLKSLMASTFSIPYIKSKCPGLMRQPEEGLVKQRPPSLGKSPLFFVDESVLPAKICNSLPVLFAQLSDSNVNKFLTLLMKASGNSKLTAAVILLTIYQDEKARSKIPESFIDQLLKNATPDNITRCQLICDCIAHHAATYRGTLNTILKFLNPKCKVPTACFISTSIVRFVPSLSEKVINQLLESAEQRLKDPQSVNYALHFMGALYEAKSVELVSLCNGDHQLQVWYNLLNAPVMSSPYTLSMISFCVEKLLPILLPFLSNPSTQALLRIVMIAFLRSPLQFSKEFFHYIYRAVIAFSPDVALKFNIKYPESILIPTELKLAVCGSLADLNKVKPLPSSLFDLIPQLIVLLQKTKDERVNHFIVAIAKSFDEKHFSEPTMISYFRLAKKILSSNSTPGFGEATVEPNTYVKSNALHIIRALFPMLANHQPLITECLDNLMTSTTRAIETTKIELHSVAYPILTDVVEKFRYTKEKEGQHRLLELYESQFSIATRFAFPTSVDVSCDFLVSYLDFYFDDYLNNQQSFIMLLDGYVNGLQRVVDKTSGFFSVASRLCILARDSQTICDQFIDFLKTLTPIFTQLVLDSIKLRSTRSDWEEVSRYRSRMSPFYHNLLSSFVWLHKTFPSEETVINIDSMSSFFLLEMTISSESWRIYAAFDAFTSLFRYFPDKIDINMMSSITFACADSVQKNKQLLGPLIPNFLLYTSRMLKNEEPYSEIWNYLCIILFKGMNCEAEALGLLIKNAPHPNMTVKFAQLITNKVSMKTFTEDEGIMLMTIIFESAKPAIPAVVKLLCTCRIGHVVHFKITSLERALTRSTTRESFDKLAYYVVKHFDEGGVELVSKLIVRKPDSGLGIELLARGAAKASILSIDKTIDDAIESLRFFQLSLSCVPELKNEKLFAIEVVKAAIHAIAKWGTDKKRGKQLISEVSILIGIADSQIDKEVSKKAYDEMSPDERDEAINNMQKFAQSAKKKKSKLSLKKFSANVVRKPQNEEGEWQSLDVED